MVSITALIQAYPHVSIITISIVISFFVSLVNYFILDKERVRELRSRQKKMQQEIMGHQKAGNHEKALQLQKDSLTDSLELMKHSFKPALITMIPLLIVFGLLRGVYSTTSLASNWLIFPVWVWYYILSALVSSILFRKLFKLP